MRLATAALSCALAACTAAPVATSPTPPASALASPTTVATAAPSPTLGVGRPAPSSVAVTAVATLPRDFIYVETGAVNDMDLWLVDLTGGTAPISVVRWTGGNGTSAVSDDGQTIIVSAPGDRSKYALMLVNPLTGRATVLFDGPADGRVFYPRLSPDGRRFAFQLYRDRGTDGYFVGETGTGVVSHLMNAPDTGGLLDWSADSTSITYSSDQADPLGGQHVFMSNVVDATKTTVSPGNLDALRAREPKVVTAMVGGRGNQGAFGADVYVYDTAARRETKLFSIEPRVTELKWSPARDEFLFLEESVGCRFNSSVWISSTAGARRRFGTIANADTAWWSRDGTTVYALVPGTGAGADIVDAATGRRIAALPVGGRRFVCP
jgi:dipeptidyl aminopeptidase/acylaminoacyl peptidase